MNKLLYILLFFVLTLNANSNGVENYLKNILSGYEKYEYELVSKPIGIENIDDANLRIDNTKQYRLNGKYLYLPVIIGSNGTSKSSYLTLSVKLFKEVFAAISDIKKDEKLSPELFKVELREITQIRMEPIADLFNITEFQSKMKIDAGEVLTKNMIEGNPIVHAGDMVSAYSEYGSINISFQAKVREDGVFGEKIRIVRSDNKIFLAEVVDSKSVKIIE